MEMEVHLGCCHSRTGINLFLASKETKKTHLEQLEEYSVLTTLRSLLSVEKIPLSRRGWDPDDVVLTVERKQNRSTARILWSVPS